MDQIHQKSLEIFQIPDLSTYQDKWISILTTTTQKNIEFFYKTQDGKEKTVRLKKDNRKKALDILKNLTQSMDSKTLSYTRICPVSIFTYKYFKYPSNKICIEDGYCTKSINISCNDDSFIPSIERFGSLFPNHTPIIIDGENENITHHQTLMILEIKNQIEKSAAQPLPAGYFLRKNDCVLFQSHQNKRGYPRLFFKKSRNRTHSTAKRKNIVLLKKTNKINIGLKKSSTLRSNKQG